MSFWTWNLIYFAHLLTSVCTGPMSWTTSKTIYYNEAQILLWASQWQNSLVQLHVPKRGQGDPVPKARTAWEAGGTNLHMVLPRLSSNLGCHFFPHCLFSSYVKLGFVFIFCHNQGAWKAIYCFFSLCWKRGAAWSANSSPSLLLGFDQIWDFHYMLCNQGQTSARVLEQKNNNTRRLERH